MTKICSKCEKEKLLEEFYADKTKKEGLRHSCKECDKQNKKQYYKKNKEKIGLKHKEYYVFNKEKIKQYLEDNKIKIKIQKKKWRIKNIEYISEREKEYRKNNRRKLNEYYSKYRINRKEKDGKFAMVLRLRKRLWEAFNDYSTNGKVRRAEEYGIDYQAICEHLGPCPGDRSDYHIDHIKPLCSFDFDDPIQIKEAFAPDNHQWLTAEENLSKGNKK